jgi:hypothetical protein
MKGWGLWLVNVEDLKCCSLCPVSPTTIVLGMLVPNSGFRFETYKLMQRTVVYPRGKTPRSKHGSHAVAIT